MESIILPLVGGIIIGLATTLMMVFNGRITGISGILGVSLGRVENENYWRYSFLVGLLFGGGLLYLSAPQFFDYNISFSYPEAIIAGLLVGIGTRVGSGCTSGHGVCGLSRLSVRGFTATMIFIGVAIVTVVLRGLL